MNKLEIESEFEDQCRLAGISSSDLEQYKNRWIANAHRFLCKEFLVPSLRIVEEITSIKDQEYYCFPYPYDGGGDITILYSGKRIDPYPEAELELAYDRRTGNKGSVRYYDWSGIVNEDLLVVTDAVFFNNSVTVTSVSNPFVEATHEGQWIRFDPFTDDDGDIQNPGDFGYRIDSVDSAGQITLEEVYRGPNSPTIGSTMRVRPKETQRFRFFGIPSASEDDIKLIVYRTPRRLYNNCDVPEYPDMGLPIAFQAVSFGLDHLERSVESQKWEQRAFAALSGLKRRRHIVDTLTPDLPQSRIIGRRTGLPNIYDGRYGGIR